MSGILSVEGAHWDVTWAVNGDTLGHSNGGEVKKGWSHWSPVSELANWGDSEVHQEDGLVLASGTTHVDGGSDVDTWARRAGISAELSVAASDTATNADGSTGDVWVEVHLWVVVLGRSGMASGHLFEVLFKINYKRYL